MYEKTYKLCLSGMCIALYISILYFTQSVSFGQFQIRFATAIYALVYFWDFLCIPLAIANMMSNFLFGATGLFDIIGGFLIGMITTKIICILKKRSYNVWICCLPIAIAPTLIVPIWMSVILSVPYHILIISMAPGQIVAYLTAKVFIIPIARLVCNIKIRHL